MALTMRFALVKIEKKRKKNEIAEQKSVLFVWLVVNRG
jgi:hypothetical protein